MNDSKPVYLAAFLTIAAFLLPTTQADDSLVTFKSLSPDTASRKAWTAVSFRSDTLSLAENTGPDSPQTGARQISGALLLGGGVPVMASGSIVGGIGVSGAPSGEADHKCAQAGISAVAAKLELAD